MNLWSYIILFVAVRFSSDTMYILLPSRKTAVSILRCFFHNQDKSLIVSSCYLLTAQESDRRNSDLSRAAYYIERSLKMKWLHLYQILPRTDELLCIVSKGLNKIITLFFKLGYLLAPIFLLSYTGHYRSPSQPRVELEVTYWQYLSTGVVGGGSGKSLKQASTSSRLHWLTPPATGKINMVNSAVFKATQHSQLEGRTRKGSKKSEDIVEFYSVT